MMAVRTVVAGLVGGLLIASCAADAAERGGLTAGSAPGSNECPVTVPAQPGFVPPEPYPARPPFDRAWYGTRELWTLLDANGQVWGNLPVGEDGSTGDKTLWFSERFSTASGEDFSGDADITITARRLDGSAATVVEEGGVPSFNRDIKNFILVGLGVPEPGCWEVTARYKGAELTYVLRVEEWTRP